VSKWVPFLLQREWQNGMEESTVAAGRNRSFFVDANGALLACGTEKHKEAGLLGLQGGMRQSSLTAGVPTPVPSMVGVRIRSVTAHNNCNLAVSEAGQLFAWGLRLSQEHFLWRDWQARVPTVMEELRNHRVRQVVASHYHCAAVTEDGALFTWYVSDEGDPSSEVPEPELGYGRFVHEFGVPHRVLFFDQVRIVTVAVGAAFTVAVTEAGAVYSFGMGDGRLGHGEGDEDDNVFHPKRIEALDGIHVATVAAGMCHALALTRCGRVYEWIGLYSSVHGHGQHSMYNTVHGHGADSDVGADEDNEIFNVPQLMTALLGERVRAIAAGPEVSCAATDAGGLYTWGQNRDNLGHGDARHRYHPRSCKRFTASAWWESQPMKSTRWRWPTMAASTRLAKARVWASAGWVRVRERMKRRAPHGEFPTLVCMVPRR
jgi:alpha-tubulin suppressor-like RCC1 family protein